MMMKSLPLNNTTREKVDSETNCTQVSRSWKVWKHGPRNYTAKRAGEPGWLEQTRFYFSRESLEADLGKMIFADELKRQ